MTIRWKKVVAALSIGMTCFLAIGCVNIKDRIPFFSTTSDEKDESGDKKVKDDKSEEPEILTTLITFVNFTDMDIYSLYASTTDSDEWEEDLLGDDIMEPGNYADVKFKYTEDELVWDFAIEDDEGNMLEFYDLDFSDYVSDGITIYFNEDGSAEICEGTDDYQTKIEEWLYLNAPEQFSYDSEELFLVYKPILEEYWSGYVLGDYSDVCDSDLLDEYETGTKEIGYAYIDIDSDGVSEILIGEAGDSNQGEFVAIYGVDDSGYVVEIETATSEVKKYLCYDGSIASLTDHEARDVRNSHMPMTIEFTALMDLPYSVFH